MSEAVAGLRGRICGAVLLLRVEDWAHFLALPILSVNISTISWGSLACSLIAAASYLAFAYGYNEFRDRRLEILSGTALRERIGLGPLGLRGLFGGLILISLASAVSVRLWVGGVAAFGILGAILYSGGLRLKRLPVVGSLTNLWIFVPLAFFGGYPEACPGFGHLLCAFCALLLQSQLIHEASHAQDDLRENIHTTALAFGPVAVRLLTTLLGLGASLALALLAVSSGAWAAAGAAAVIGLFSVTACVLVDFRVLATAHRLRLAHRYISLFGGTLAWWSVA